MAYNNKEENKKQNETVHTSSLQDRLHSLERQTRGIRDIQQSVLQHIKV